MNAFSNRLLLCLPFKKQLNGRRARLLQNVSFSLLYWFELHSLGRAASAPVPPPDWRIELVAQAPDIRHPSVVCVAPDHRVFVAEDPMDISTPHADASEGRIICFHPDGHRTIFAEKLHAVFGLQYLEGKLFVLHNPQLTVFSDAKEIGTNRVELIESLNPNPWALDWNDHVPANFKLGMDGYFYMAVGDKGIYGAVGRDGKRVDLHGGGILRFRPDGTELEVYSTGVRNVLDVALTDEDDIFTYDNTDEHDWMGRLTHMVDGGFYGYPHDFVPRRPYALWMMHDFGGGAACGTLAYTEDALPDEYHNNLFLSDFGKRQVLRVRLERAGATWRVHSHAPFFRNVPEDFRPVGIDWGADGKSFYICDWQHRDTKENVVVGRLWKASYSGPAQGRPKPNWYLPAALGQPFQATTEDLVDGLQHRSKKVRLQAQRELSRGRNRDEFAKLIETFRQTNVRAETRWHALWGLDALDGGRAARQIIVSAANDPDPSIRRQVIRQLGQRRAPQAIGAIVQRLADPDPSVRFQSATALGRIAATNTVGPLVTALAESDLFARYAMFTALNRIGRANPNAWPAIATGLANDNPRIREATGFAMRETYEPKLVEALAGFPNQSTGDPTSAAAKEGRLAAVRVLSSVMCQPNEWKGEWGAYHPALAPPPLKTNTWNATEQILSTLRHLLDDSDADVRVLAITALQKSNDGLAVSRLFLQRFDRELETRVRIALIDALGELREKSFSSTLANALRIGGTEPAVFAAMTRAAGRLQSQDLDQTLVGLLSDKSLATAARIEVVNALAECKSTNALPSIEPLLASGERTLRVAAFKAATQIGGSAASEMLRGLLGHSSVEIRREAILALGQLRDRSSVSDLLLAWKSPETREAALTALAQLKDSRAVDAYLNGLEQKDANLRAQARSALTAIRQEALPLIEARSAGLSDDVLRKVRLIYQGNPRAKKGPLFANSPPPPSMQDFFSYAMAHSGEPMRGRRIFSDEARVGCIKCHAVGATGGKVGPDLTMIGEQFPRNDLIEHVLAPSKVVREGYQQWNIETTDGESYSGLIQAETPENVILINSEGRLQTIPKGAIASRTASKLSLMPEGLQNGLSLDEFADLIAFLESLRSDRRSTGDDESSHK